MECPKCGTVQENGREECSACGIIIARWQPRAPRTPTMERRFTYTTQEAPKPVPWTLIIIGVTFAVIFGLIWTKHYRERKVKNADDILNEINQKGIQTRQRIREEQSSMARATAREVPRTAGRAFPAELGERGVHDLIEACGYFQNPVSFEIPKEFARAEYPLMRDRYPALAASEREHLVEFDPPLAGNPPVPGVPTAPPPDKISVKLTPYVYSKVDVSDRGGPTYEFIVGRRRVDTITTTQKQSDSQWSFGFTWAYEKPIGNAIAADYQNHTGGADIQRSSTGWGLNRAWTNNYRGSQAICP